MASNCANDVRITEPEILTATSMKSTAAKSAVAVSQAEQQQHRPVAGNENDARKRVYNISLLFGDLVNKSHRNLNGQSILTLRQERQPCINATENHKCDLNISLLFGDLVKKSCQCQVEQGENHVSKPQLTTMMPTQQLQLTDGQKFDPDKRKQIQQQLIVLLHAHKCLHRDTHCNSERQCLLPYCLLAKGLLNHMLTCRESKACLHPHCASSRQILSHWKDCTHADCPVCSIVKHTYQKRVRRSVSEPVHPQVPVLQSRNQNEFAVQNHVNNSSGFAFAETSAMCANCTSQKPGFARCLKCNYTMCHNCVKTCQFNHICTNNKPCFNIGFKDSPAIHENINLCSLTEDEHTASQTIPEHKHQVLKKGVVTGSLPPPPPLVPITRRAILNHRLRNLNRKSSVTQILRL